MCTKRVEVVSGLLVTHPRAGHSLLTTPWLTTILLTTTSTHHSAFFTPAASLPAAFTCCSRHPCCSLHPCYPAPVPPPPFIAAGMWWLPTAGEQLHDAQGGHGLTALMGRGAGTGGAGGGLDPEEAQLLKMAAEQRMNTDTRRAVFVAIMGSDDCVEAHEKLLRLPLKVG